MPRRGQLEGSATAPGREVWCVVLEAGCVGQLDLGHQCRRVDELQVAVADQVCDLGEGLEAAALGGCLSGLERLDGRRLAVPVGDDGLVGGWSGSRVGSDNKCKRGGAGEVTTQIRMEMRGGAAAAIKTMQTTHTLVSMQRPEPG